MTQIDGLIAEVYATAGNRLGAYGFVLTGTRADAEELVQAALVKTLVRRRRLPNTGAVEGYVRATMRTMHIDRIRRERTFSRVAAAASGDAAHADPADAVAQGGDIESALASLPPQVRTAVALRYYDDLTVAQVAQVMGLKDGTVKKYLADGRARLAPLLGLGDGDAPERVDVVERTAP